MTNANMLLGKMFADSSVQRELGLTPDLENLNFLVSGGLSMNHPLQKYWGYLILGDSESCKPQQEDIILLLGEVLEGDVV